MGWRDLIQFEEQTISVPWTGGRSLRYHSRLFVIEGRLPHEHGWYSFSAWHKEARLIGPADLNPEMLRYIRFGFLAGDRFIPDDTAATNVKVDEIAQNYQKVWLVEEGLDRFARIEVGSMTPNFETIFYKSMSFPLGPEEEVLSAYLDQKDSISDIKGVTPALEVAFKMESWQRREAERRRIELAQLRREEAERLAREQRRQELVEKLGSGAGRRELATVDFHEAAKAALAVGNAELLDVRDSRRGEKVVTYRLDGRSYECICDEQMRIIDSGICLQDHDTGEKGDTYFTLESLPAVIRQADRENKLVVYRHV